MVAEQRKLSRYLPFHDIHKNNLTKTKNYTHCKCKLNIKTYSTITHHEVLYNSKLKKILGLNVDKNVATI
jgi:uncharacterized protein (DUF427 family)